MQSDVPVIAPANANHQNRGAIQTSHGIGLSRGTPSKNSLIAPSVFGGKSQGFRCGWSISAHPFSGEAK